ncbi:MAG: hypothetical protein JRJ48_06730, partial [Deltaproteobacteria bacterium]|nr:hypothetical protein [Deltaproteobacteria bacterium]
KDDNAELQEKLNRASRSSASSAATAPSALPSGGQLGWEEQKRLLLVQLEADFDEEPSSGDRMTIESTIRITDDVVAAKDQEIASLKQQLEDALASSAATPPAVDYSEVIDQDEAIQIERKNLRTLQQEWQEKIREAEISISTERAKIARERTKWEEKIASLTAVAPENLPVIDEAKKKKSSGRWLTRLGLQEADEE